LCVTSGGAKPNHMRNFTAPVLRRDAKSALRNRQPWQCRSRSPASEPSSTGPRGDCPASQAPEARVLLATNYGDEGPTRSARGASLSGPPIGGASVPTNRRRLRCSLGIRWRIQPCLVGGASCYRPSPDIEGHGARCLGPLDRCRNLLTGPKGHAADTTAPMLPWFCWR
jgi:hypothetical protein